MNGAESLLRTLLNGGVDVCFANPGTSEMQFVAAVDRVPGMRTVLGLFEGVVAGAADGYGRMTDKPAATLLHLGPGFANGLANFHNATRANTPIVNIIGDHASYHLAFDSPLTADIEAYARPVSKWIRTIGDGSSVAADTAEAIAASRAAPGQVATLIVPADVAWGDAAGPAPAIPVPPPQRVADERVRRAADVLRRGEPTVILLGDRGLREHGLQAAGRIAKTTGARLFSDCLFARLERGAGRVAVERMPYFGEVAVDLLSGTRHMILAGVPEPVTFFAYPGKPSVKTPAGCEVHNLAQPGDDVQSALEALAEELPAAHNAVTVTRADAPPLPRGQLTPDAVAMVIGALLPEGAILSEEAATCGFRLLSYCRDAPPHDVLTLTGGAIGQGLPVAVGAGIACPDRKVIALEADGSGMYTVQSLWTMAREGLDVVTVIFANRKYAILQLELQRLGIQQPGPKALDMLDLRRPELNWVHIAAGMGVPGEQVHSAEDFAGAFRRGLAEPGPYLIEAVLHQELA